MARVARPGAVVAGLNEGTRGVGRSPENPDQAAEKEVGINEHVHTVWAYLACVRLGRPSRTAGRAPGRLAAVAVRAAVCRRSRRSGSRSARSMHLSAVRFCGVSIYARKPA